MQCANRFWLLAIALTACAANGGRQAAESPPCARAATPLPSKLVGSRLGPPSARGIGFRRVDRPSVGELPLALY